MFSDAIHFASVIALKMDVISLKTSVMINYMKAF